MLTEKELNDTLKTLRDSFQYVAKQCAPESNSSLSIQVNAAALANITTAILAIEQVKRNRDRDSRNI